MIHYEVGISQEYLITEIEARVIWLKYTFLRDIDLFILIFWREINWLEFVKNKSKLWKKMMIVWAHGCLSDGTFANKFIYCYCSTSGLI